MITEAIRLAERRVEATRATVEGTGVMRRAAPETPAEREQRRVEAVVAVLRSRLPEIGGDELLLWVSDGWVAKLAAECIAAADTGI